MTKIFFKFSLVTFLFATLTACEKQRVTEADSLNVERTIEQKAGAYYSKINAGHFKPPLFTNLKLPREDQGAVSWGATGRDDVGNIYVGVSTYSQYHNTAFLYQIDSSTQSIKSQSDVITQLKKSNFYAEGISQNKLHSKFYQADDGYIYFTSFDENGESESKGILPMHGGHLWRKKPDSEDWEHLLATREALIALNTDGRFVYALGYWNHVLYQYDTLSRRFNRTTVGSIKGHVSRNFLVGRNGHVFVPKVDLNTDKSTLVNLMEYDTELKLVDTHPIEHYRSDQRFMGHGIIAYSHMKNGDIYFTTSVGALYKLSMLSNSKHNLEFISFIDEANQPGGYFPSMFSLDGTDFLVGLGRIPNKPTYSWFIYNISSETLVTYQIKELDGHFLLYGSLTRDNNGNLYVVGVDRTDKQKHVPQVLQLSYPNAPMTR